MVQKIKNFFRNLKWNKKRSIPTSPLPKRRLWFGGRAFAFVPVLIFLGIAAISGGLLGVFGDNIFTSTLANLGLALAVLVLQIPLALTNAFLSMSIAILGVVTSPGFISLSYTNPAGNEFLAVGWALTRDLANIGFVIVLVIIGLATALKIREYQWQKTLPLLIGIALLINFTPVILGLIVDASNIVMHFFLGDMIDFTFVANIWHGQLNTLLETGEWSRDINVLPFAQTLFLIVFGFISGLIFFLFSFLFILRYIAIWMLVILSPIAFFCYILPATRGLFNTWWNQFIQWSIIGVAAAFFLWLSSHLLLLSWEGKVMGGTFDMGEKATAPIAEMMNQLLPYSIGIGFLIVGFFVALSTSAMGATGIITAFQKGTRVAAKGVGRFAERRAIGPAAGKVAKGLGAAAAWSRRLEEKAGRVGKFASKPLRWVTRGIEMAAVPTLTEYAAKKRRVTLPTGWKQMSIPEKEGYISALSMASDRLVLASEMKGEGTFQKAADQFQENILKVADKFKGDARYKKEVGDILDALPDKVTKKIKLEYELAGVKDPSKIAKIKSDFQNDIQDVIDEFGRQHITVDGNMAAAILHARSLKSKDIAEVIKGSLKSEPFQMAMQKMSSSHLQSLQNNFDEHTVRDVLEINKGLNKIITNQAEIKEIYKKNPRLVRWAFETPAGKEMLNWESKYKKPY